jgi:ribosomal protein S18 acetylase RimI-like enzyme
MSAAPVVRVARADENAVASEVLTDAFVNEDGLNYWLRQGAAKERARRRFFDAGVRDLIHPQRDLWLAESEGRPVGAAIWLAPGRKPFEFNWYRELLITPLFFSVAGAAGMKRATELGKRLADHHPRVPHAHLVFLGVHSAAQGHGVGSAILKTTLAPIDAQGVTAYLEASTERNVALYKRHGFEVTGEFELPGLHFWTMTRPARG